MSTGAIDPKCKRQELPPPPPPPLLFPLHLSPAQPGKLWSHKGLKGVCIFFLPHLPLGFQTSLLVLVLPVLIPMVPTARGCDLVPQFGFEAQLIGLHSTVL